MQTQNTQQFIDEVHLLNQFDLHSMQQGIKVHNDAAKNMVSACKSLHKKGLIDQQDGGYLTHRGVEVAKHAQSLMNALQYNAEKNRVL